MGIFQPMANFPNQSESNLLTLIGKQKAEFDYASKTRSWTLRSQMALGLLSAVTVFISKDKYLYAAAIPTVLLIGMWFFQNARMVAARAFAERLRRATLILGGLGVEVSGDEMFELTSSGFSSISEAKRLIDPDYFADKGDPGPSRLSQWLEESATWTTTLADVAAREAWLYFGAALVTSLVVLLASILLLNIEEWERAARVFFAVLAVMLSADFLGSAIAYRAASGEARRIIERIQKNRVQGQPIEALMVLVTDYNSVVESMPLFPKGLYNRHRERLQQAFQLYLTGNQ